VEMEAELMGTPGIALAGWLTGSLHAVGEPRA